MRKVYHISDEKNMLAFSCPGCRCDHLVRVNGPSNEVGQAWQWNGSYDQPTFKPSIFVNADGACPTHPRCHSFVTNGLIQFLSDSTHDFAGQTVDLPDVGES